MTRSTPLVAGFCAALTLISCTRSGTPTQPAAADTSAPSAIYTVRGVVEALPGDEPLRVHHEAIDNFADQTGQVIGMNSMTMPFPLAKGVSLDGIEKGDKVELTFAVWWKPRRHWEATKVVELPPDTPLTFGPATPPAATPPAAPPTAPAPAPTPSGG